MYSRRLFLKSLGGIAAMTALPSGGALAAGNRIIVVGGGVAGTRLAAYLKMTQASSTVQLFDTTRHTGVYRYATLKADHEPVARAVLDRLGVQTITAQVARVDADNKTVTLGNGKSFAADILALAPGIDFDWGSLRGYTPGMERDVLHAWLQQTGDEHDLWQRIAAMRDGDSVVISVPRAPYRFPQGPYQRASDIADYLDAHKPHSKVLVLDSNNEFPGMQARLEQWQARIASNRVEWVPASAGGVPERFDIHNNKVTVAGETLSAGVLNLIPPQRAAYIARQAGLCDGEWCPVDAHSMESSRFKNVFVLGDANDANLYAKTAVTAQQHALNAARYIASVTS